MNFKEAYNFLISLSNLPRKEYLQEKKDEKNVFKRIQLFLDLLDNPEKKIPHYIHITGTSGKGSTTANLHSILSAAGKKVGSSYSPHPTVITERWKIGKKHISKKEFAAIVTELKEVLDTYIRTYDYDTPSFFELTEIIGFVWFQKMNVEWVVLEVGLGGRYDSTNIIPHKDVAAITNIGLDHMHILGDTKEEIAYDKSGIIKKGSAVFTTESQDHILSIIKKEAQKVGADSFTSIKPKTIKVLDQQMNGTTFLYKEKEYKTSAPGEHQAINAALCIDIAEHIGISTKHIRNGLLKAVQPLRMEVVSQDPIMLLDGAHNEDKMKSSINTLKKINTKHKDIHLVIGFCGNKEIKKMLKALSTLSPKSIVCTRNTVNLFRKVSSPKDMAKQLKKILPNTLIEVCLDPHEALAWSTSQAEKNDILLITGSIFLSGQLRGSLMKR